MIFSERGPEGRNPALSAGRRGSPKGNERIPREYRINRQIRVPEVRIVEEDCIGCKLCAQYCPWETIYMFGNPAFAAAKKVEAAAK